MRGRLRETAQVQVLGGERVRGRLSGFWLWSRRTVRARGGARGAAGLARPAGGWMYGPRARGGAGKEPFAWRVLAVDGAGEAPGAGHELLTQLPNSV